MGLLDSILGSVMGGAQGQGSVQGALMNAVMQIVANKAGGGAGGSLGGLGGLGGLVGALTQGGLGDAASSWVGKGENLPVSADQIQSALGSGAGGGILAQLAQSAGLSQGDAASGLSQLLPGLVDKLTPDGQIPQQGTLEKLLGAFNVGK